MKYRWLVTVMSVLNLFIVGGRWNQWLTRFSAIAVTCTMLVIWLLPEPARLRREEEAAPPPDPSPLEEPTAPARLAKQAERAKAPKLHTFSARRAFATSIASSAGINTLGAVLDEIRAAAEQGRLSCTPKSMTDVHRVILLYIGYGSSSDGSIHWSGTDKFCPDPMPSIIARDYTLNQFVELAEDVTEDP